MYGGVDSDLHFCVTQLHIGKIDRHCAKDHQHWKYDREHWHNCPAAQFGECQHLVLQSRQW
jgi:hypothetical protein